MMNKKTFEFQGSALRACFLLSGHFMGCLFQFTNKSVWMSGNPSHKLFILKFFLRNKYTWVMNYCDIFWYKSSFTQIIVSIHASSYEGFASEAWTSGLYCWSNVNTVANGCVLRVVKERSFVHSNLLLT